jgi:hypothetical protein
VVDPVRIHRLALEEFGTGADVFGEAHRYLDSGGVRPPLL